MISDIRKCIFIQIPKNAGSSMVKYFSAHDFYKISLSNNNPKWDKGQYKMGTARRVRQLHRTVWLNYFKFTFIRNPWDRVVSSWMWLVKTGKVRKMGFKKFVMEYPFEHPGADWHSLPQYVHIYNKHLCPMVNFVGRFENLDNDFKKVCSMIGIKYKSGQLPHEKKTKHKPYWEHYDDDTIKRCASIFQKDIELFGYEFR